MENVQHPNGFTERRVMSRIDAALRINYQIISDDVALMILTILTSSCPAIFYYLQN